MKKISFVGLGNYGKEYSSTRHNVGFIVVDHLNGFFGFGEFNRFKSEVEYSAGEIAGYRVFFLKPITYMNNSGIALKKFCDYNNISSDDLIIIYDDIDIEIGKIRIKNKGSDGGHKGVRSIIDNFKTTEIKRIRVGIGPKKGEMDLSDYVLSNFSKDEMIKINGLLKVFPEIIKDIISGGMEQAMNKYNR